jgi:uncharacterized membrane protein YcjF (UPF0283 family)
MNRLTLVALLGLIAASAVAWRLGGTLGAGVLSGYAAGAAMSGLGALHQSHVVATHPERLFQAFGVAFLAKLAVLLVGAFSLRYIEPVAVRADWQGFVVAFAAAAALLAPLAALSSLRTLQALRERSAS